MKKKQNYCHFDVYFKSEHSGKTCNLGFSAPDTTTLVDFVSDLSSVNSQVGNSYRIYRIERTMKSDKT